MISTQLMDLPYTIRGFTAKSCDDAEDHFTIVINSALSIEEQRRAFLHEMDHINCDDFYCCASVNDIERLRHD